MDKIQTDALIELGASMTGLEASDIANYLEDGYPLEEAFSNVQEFHRKRICELFEIAGFGDDDEQQVQETIKELRGIQGAYRDPEQTTAVWTSPHGLVREGDLNSSRSHMIEAATSSIVCSTFNFQRSSALWESLKKAATLPGMSVKIYVDTSANSADDTTRKGKGPTSPTPEEIAKEIVGAKVFCTAKSDKGYYYRNHAKFISVDHQDLLVTSANFSYSAEELNIELGLRIHDEALAESIERQMANMESRLYRRVGVIEEPDE